MKTCTKCKVSQPLDAFHKGREYLGGLRTWCKTCMSAYKKQYRDANKEKLAEAQRIYDEKINPLRRDYFKARYAAQREKILAQNTAYRKANPEAHATKEARRRAAKLQRTPGWLTKDDFWMIEQAYELAAIRTKMLGIPFEVDHVLPLQGKLVSGFHSPENLQVIPARLNRSKHNSFEVVL